jgi:hypothetical protein
VLDGSGAIVEEGRIQTNASSFRLRFAGAAPARIAIEVGTHPPWVSALLQELGHEVRSTTPRHAGSRLRPCCIANSASNWGSARATWPRDRREKGRS